MSNSFATPGTASSGISWEEHKGDLLLINVHSVESGIKTSFGDKEAVRADITALTAEPVEYLDSLVFPKVVVSQLRSRVGQRVLGRLTQGSAKPGQKPPWMLDEATADDIKKATDFLAGGISTPDDDAPPF